MFLLCLLACIFAISKRILEHKDKPFVLASLISLWIFLTIEELCTNFYNANWDLNKMEEIIVYPNVSIIFLSVYQRKVSIIELLLSFCFASCFSLIPGQSIRCWFTCITHACAHMYVHDAVFKLLWLCFL